MTWQEKLVTPLKKKRAGSEKKCQNWPLKIILSY